MKERAKRVDSLVKEGANRVDILWFYRARRDDHFDIYHLTKNSDKINFSGFRSSFPITIFDWFKSLF